MKPKPDDRGDNVERIQNAIDHTIANIRESENAIEATDDPQYTAQLDAKNARRDRALDGLRAEIKDEAGHRQSQHKQS